MIVNFPSHYTRIKCFLQEAIFDKSTLTPGASRLHWSGRHRARTSQPALTSSLVTKQLNTRQWDGTTAGDSWNIFNRADKKSRRYAKQRRVTDGVETQVKRPSSRRGSLNNTAVLVSYSTVLWTGESPASSTRSG